MLLCLLQMDSSISNENIIRLQTRLWKLSIPGITCKINYYLYFNKIENNPLT